MEILEILDRQTADVGELGGFDDVRTVWYFAALGWRWSIVCRVHEGHKDCSHHDA